MTLTDNTRQEPDILLKQIADYVSKPLTINETAYKTAHYSLFDALGCAIAALRFPDCKRLLGPIVNGQTVQFGAHVPGTNYYLDPVQAAFNIGTLIRWLDYNDTWLAAEWGHPSDNLGAILAVTDYLNQQQKKLTMRDVLIALIKAYEIQGVLALNHSFNAIGLDHVILVKVASTALATHLFGGTPQNIIDALSQAWLDGQSLRTYRHAPNTGSRKSWAAGDATSRGVRLSMLTLLGEPGYPTVMTAPQWGFEDVYWFGKSLNLAQPLGTYVIENILYKVQYPAEFHAQTAVEAAVKLHPHVRDRLDQIERIEIKTQSPAMRIINKTGPLYNVADRDHCLQYMVAIGLIYGKLVAEDYLDKAAANPLIDELRSCMVVTEDPDFTQDYYDPNKRTIANAVQVFFKEGDATELVIVEAPLGHRWRREEAWSALEEKFYQNVYQHFERSKTEKLLQLMRQPDEVLNYSVDEFIKLWLI